MLAPVACADFLAGPEFVLAIFYLIPIGFAAWRMMRRESGLVTVLCWTLGLYNSGVFGLHLREHPAAGFFRARCGTDHLPAGEAGGTAGGHRH
ncbi:MAG: hypothetical protein M0R77_15245 [Gammaproteobacteria bacterium]|nr:hypothetical protein [Gammaproteobacteria bacterium]